MPYQPEPDQAMIESVRNALLAVACRHADSGADPFIRIPRAALHAMTLPDLRREDFYECIRLLADETEAVREATGTGRRADVVLDRVVDEVGEWETVLYTAFPDDEPEPEQVTEYLTGLGLDVTSPVPTDLLIRRTARPPVVHDPDVPRVCAACKETKTTDNFGRRSADPSLPGYQQFQSYCNDCTRTKKREWAAAHGDYRTQRPERWGTGRTGRIRPGGRHPNNPTTSYQFTN